MDWKTTMTKFTLLKFPHSTDEIITERIASLNKLICQSGDDEHILAVLEMLTAHISLNYDGLYVDQTIAKLVEASSWWRECLDPNLTLATMHDAEE